MSGESDGENTPGPECYSNSDCSGGHECSKGVCVGFIGCGSGCRTNETCLDGVCRLQCSSNDDCETEGLICGSDTAHCKPGQNPTRPQSQPQSGSGGTGSTGAGGAASHAGAPGAGGAAHGGAPNVASSGGMPGVAGGAPASATAGGAGLSSSAGHAGL